MQYTIEDLSQLLQNHHIKPSYPRIRILEYLMTLKTHPTVDEIYKGLSREIPTLSKTTVYNTLNLLAEAKLARVLTIEENETRYDATMSDHGHFKCEACGLIWDFPVDLSRITGESLQQFRIHDKNVYFKGICNKCLKDKNNKLQGDYE